MGEREASSFRDPASRVLRRDGQVLRELSPAGVQDWQRLSSTRFFAEAVDQGRIVATTEERPDLLAHETIDCFTYPYEWSFTMLADAALLHLDLVLEALDEGMWTKDASGFNVTFRGSRPVFVDLGSFTASSAGPWPAYRQFCQHFLFPLMLTAGAEVDFQPLLRSSIDGIGAQVINRLLPLRSKATGTGLRHVVIPGVAERLSRRPSQRVADELGGAGFSTEMARAALTKLRSAVAGLDWAGGSTWVDYSRTCTYSGADRQAKANFVAASIPAGSPTVWDLGTNDGTYALIAAEKASTVVAVDGDHATIDRLYRRLRDRGSNVVPVVMDLTNPSPRQGWRGAERTTLEDRTRPDHVLALAVIHHLCLDAGVPLAEVVSWLASLGATMVLEMVHPSDPMAADLLARKPPGTHDDYTVAELERLLAGHFEVGARLDLECGTRTLYRLAPR